MKHKISFVNTKNSLFNNIKKLSTLSYLHDKSIHAKIISMNEENILIQAGLSEEQALAYQALLDKGPQKASDLSKWVGIKRGLIYKVLEQLENMGLISKKGGPGTVAVFSPAHPSLLLTNLERKEKEIALTKDILTSSIGSLSSKFNLITGKPNVQFFEGKEGIKTVILKSLIKDSTVCLYSDMEAVDKYIPEINKINREESLKNKVFKRILVVDTPYNREKVRSLDKEMREIRFIKAPIGFTTAIRIYTNAISYTTLTESKMIGVIIEDEKIYQTHQLLFDLLWSQAEKLE